MLDKDLTGGGHKQEYEVDEPYNYIFEQLDTMLGKGAINENAFGPDALDQGLKYENDGGVREWGWTSEWARSDGPFLVPLAGTAFTNWLQALLQRQPFAAYREVNELRQTFELVPFLGQSAKPGYASSLILVGRWLTQLPESDSTLAELDVAQADHCVELGALERFSILDLANGTCEVEAHCHDLVSRHFDALLQDIRRRFGIALEPNSLHTATTGNTFATSSVDEASRAELDPEDTSLSEDVLHPQRGPKAHTEDERWEIVTEWLKSQNDTTQNAFCHKHSIAASTLRSWMRQFREDGKLPPL